MHPGLTTIVTYFNKPLAQIIEEQFVVFPAVLVFFAVDEKRR